MKQKNTGFTLIELLVVIVIIGILATISTATFSSSMAKARDAKRLATAKDFQQKIQTYVTKNQITDISSLLDPSGLSYAAYYLEQEGFDFSQIEADRCIWIGYDTTDPQNFSVLFTEETENDLSFKVLGNPPSQPTLDGYQYLGKCNEPILSNYSFHLFDRDRYQCNGYCCQGYTFPGSPFGPNTFCNSP